MGILVFGLGCVACSLLYTPYVLHRIGFVDIDRIAAQTVESPYDILGIPRDSDLLAAKNAYRKESLHWHPDRNVNCGKKCEDKMSDITRAFEQIKKRRAPPPVDQTWEKWAEGHISDWDNVFKHFEGTMFKEDQDKA